MDSTDWASLVTRADGHIDPQGVYSLGEDRRRIETSFTLAYLQAATPTTINFPLEGTQIETLPAPELQCGDPSQG